jgi:hypothetical protein
MSDAFAVRLPLTIQTISPIEMERKGESQGRRGNLTLSGRKP